jgi:hypothetical protein
LPRYIATAETSKHRFFQFLGAEILPDNMLVAMALDDAFHLGVLSSRIHVIFSLVAGGRLGVGNDPRYNKSRCFDPFPFPLCGEPEQARIRQLAEELDAHRKRVQAQHGLTLTGLYNVLEKLRAAGVAAPEDGRTPGIALTEKEKRIHDLGLVSVLKQLHDDLDAAVFAAYGWPATLTDAEILERLVTLNAERAAGEARGVIHYLRPEYQARGQKTEVGGQRSGQNELTLAEGEGKGRRKKGAQPGGNARPTAGKAEWPKPLAERVRAVETALHNHGAIIGPADLATRFKGAKADDVAEILETLVTLGRARREGEAYRR